MYLNPYLKLPYLNLCLKLRLYKLRLYKLYLHKLRPLKLRPTSNLRSNLYSNLRNKPLLLYKHLISFRRSSVEGNSKTSIVPKVTIEVATSVI